jgi:uracil-DNA glycosylase
MSEEINFKRAIEQLLELDVFFTDDLAIRGPCLYAGSDTPESVSEAPAMRRQVPMTAAPVKTVKAERPAERAPAAYNYIRAGENMSKEEALEQLADRIRSCKACAIGNSRQNSVPGEGNANAELVFVGEAPGAEEDKTGRPFVGRAGQLLTKIINAMGLEREQVFICNTLKCRPPENRDPQKSEKEACCHLLRNQLSIIEPKIIVALGSHAARELLETEQTIGKLRGRFHEYKPTPDSKPVKLMPTYHPAYLLRNYSPDNRKRVWEDMQVVMDALGLNKKG